MSSNLHETAVYGLRLSFCLMLLAFASACEPTGAEAFAATRVYRHRFIETGLSGAQKIYQGYAADIATPEWASNDQMERFARDLFETRLRSMTEAEGGDLVWITFIFKELVPVQGGFGNKTYRVIFVLQNGAWGRPAPGPI